MCGSAPIAAIGSWTTRNSHSENSTFWLQGGSMSTNTTVSWSLRFYFGVHVVPLQTYNVVLAPPSVRNQSEPLAVGAVPQVEVGAPAPTPIETPLTLVLTLYGPTGATKFPGVNGLTGENTKSPSQNVPVAPTGVRPATARKALPEVVGVHVNVYSVQVVVNGVELVPLQ
jgi:hypothetical protein